MSDPIFFAPLTTPMVNPQTGIVTRQWYLLFQAIFQRVGGSLGNGTDDVQQAPQQGGNGSLDVNTLLQAPLEYQAEIRDLRDTVAELTKRVEELAQGTQL